MELNNKQKKALIKSIENKWLPSYKEAKNNYNASDVYKMESLVDSLLQWTTCELCKQFLNKSYKTTFDEYCKNCPIREYTKNICCEDTPYNKLEEYNPQAICEEDLFAICNIIKEECKFLINLLPKEEQSKYLKKL
jgi:hypothetical protein